MRRDPTPNAMLSPWLARAGCFAAGVALAVFCLWAFRELGGLTLAILSIVAGHHYGALAFEALASAEEIRADLRDRADPVDEENRTA